VVSVSDALDIDSYKEPYSLISYACYLGWLYSRRPTPPKAGLKQEDVEDFGVSWKHYQKVEAGTTNTTIRILYKLAKAFRCRPGDLLP
jgi:DNA-binding XRE family transcriptional regulator